MKPLTVKQSQRIEKKKKKMAAFLEIAKLNDIDREAKERKLRARENSTSESSDCDGAVKETATHDGPSRKRVKKHHEAGQEEPVADPLEGPQPVEADTCSFSAPSTPETAAVGRSGKVLLSGQEFLDLKRRLRERTKILKKSPLFRLKQPGELASIHLSEDDRTPLFLSDIQHLLLYSILVCNAPYNQMAWCHIDKAKNISHTVFLLVEGLSLYEYQAHESCFPTLSGCFSTKLEVITPSAYDGNFVEELALVPLAHSKENRLIWKYGSIEEALKADTEIFKVFRAIFPVLESESSRTEDDPVPVVPYPSTAHRDRFPRTQLIMSAAQLVDQEFPVPVKGPLKEKFRNYILTKDLYKEVSPESPMFALDCEMCMTTSRSLELTRISIVDEHLNCLYDQLVLPYNRIVDYLTQYSGITRSMLVGVTKRLEDVQEDIRALLPMDAILVGQSLNSDLHALRMMHPYVVDTSVIFNVTGNYKRKTKLSVLSMKFLGEEIQASASGHCSTEDSEACMKLVQLKLANSLAFGDTILASHRPEFRSMVQPTVYDTTPWRESVPPSYHPSAYPPSETTFWQHQVAETPQLSEHLATSMFTYLKHHDKSVAIVSTRGVIDEYSKWISSRLDANRRKNRRVVECLAAASRENVVPKMCGASSSHSMTMGHVALDPEELADPGRAEVAFRRVDAWCGRLSERTREHGLCVVLFGGRDGGANGVCFVRLNKPDSRGVRETC